MGGEAESEREERVLQGDAGDGPSGTEEAAWTSSGPMAL